MTLFSVVCCSWFAMICETQLSILNSVFSDIELVIWNQPCWEYLHHRNWLQIYKLGLSPCPTPLLGLVVKHLPAHHWLFSWKWQIYILLKVKFLPNILNLNNDRLSESCPLKKGVPWKSTSFILQFKPLDKCFSSKQPMYFLVGNILYA